MLPTRKIYYEPVLLRESRQEHRRTISELTENSPSRPSFRYQPKKKLMSIILTFS